MKSKRPIETVVAQVHDDRARLDRARGDLLEMNLQAENGLTVSVDEFRKAYGSTVVALRQGLLRVASDLPQLAAHLTLHEIHEMDRIIRLAMTEVARYGPEEVTSKKHKRDVSRRNIVGDLY